MPKHAYLSASASHRWIACPPSAKLCAAVNDSASPYAQQGTDAHTLCEYKLRSLLEKNAEDPTENLTYYDAEMNDAADEYAAYIMEQLHEARKKHEEPIILIEEKLDFSRWVPEGFGTGDCVILTERLLHIIDFKYGLGVLVEAAGNPQMMCYALGALDTYGCLFNIQTIRMTIFQPRRDNISTHEISTEDLLRWAEETLRPRAALAYNGEGEFAAGSHCQFCKVKNTCRKRAEKNLELTKHDFAMPPHLNEAEIALILPLIDELLAWAGDIKEHALQQALSGTEYPGFKLVEGRSARKYTDEAAVAAIVTAAGYDPYAKKLLGVTAMTSLLGKNKYNELLGSLTAKPQGKPVLVPATDKRPPLNAAAEDFKQE